MRVAGNHARFAAWVLTRLNGGLQGFSATRLRDNKWIVVPIVLCLLGALVVANMLYPPENYEAIALPILEVNRWPRPNASAPFIMGGSCVSSALLRPLAFLGLYNGALFEREL